MSDAEVDTERAYVQGQSYVHVAFYFVTIIISTSHPKFIQIRSVHVLIAYLAATHTFVCWPHS